MNEDTCHGDIGAAAFALLEMGRRGLDVLSGIEVMLKEWRDLGLSERQIADGLRDLLASACQIAWADNAELTDIVKRLADYRSFGNA